MGGTLILAGLILVIFAVLNTFRPWRFIGITTSWVGVPAAISGVLLFAMGGNLENHTRVPIGAIILGFMAIGLFAFGLVRVLRPMRELGIPSRGWATAIFGGSFLFFFLAVTIYPHAFDDQPTTSKPAADITPPATRNETPQTMAETGQATQAPSAAVSPSSSSTSQPAPSSVTAPASIVPQPVRPTSLVNAEVLRTVDGDTVVVKLDSGKLVTVRLIGVDTPETVHPTKPVQPYGPEASAYTQKHLWGQRVGLEYDVERHDKYGRELAYIWVGDELFNATLIREGYAQMATFPPNVKYVYLYRQLQTEAREAKRGLWGIPSQPEVATEPTPPSKDEPGTTAAQAALAQQKRGSFPPTKGECMENGIRYIKGNANSMLYHYPGGQFYDTTYAEACFYTAEDAKAAGYTASKR